MPGNHTIVGKKAETSHCSTHRENWKDFFLLSKFLLAHIAWPLFSLLMWRSGQRLGYPVKAAQSTPLAPHCSWCWQEPTKDHSIFSSTICVTLNNFFTGRVNLRLLTTSELNFVKGQPGQGHFHCVKGKWSTVNSWLVFLVVNENISYSTVGNVSFDTNQIHPSPLIPASLSFSVGYFKCITQFYNERFSEKHIFYSNAQPVLLNVSKILFLVK